MNSVNTLVDSLRERLPSNALWQLEGRFSYSLPDPLPTLMQTYRDQGCLTRAQANKIVQWKTAKRDGERFIKENKDDEVKQLTKFAAYLADNCKEFPEVAACPLISMKRVDYPVASAILTAWNPDEFGIIDKRCWSALHKLTGLKNFDRGKRSLFKTDEFHLYICILRRWSDLDDVSPRLIDKALWQFDKENPATLYEEGITFTDHQFIIRKEGILSGEPIIKCTRTPVRAVVENSRLGHTPVEIFSSLPHLSLEAINDALSYYNAHTKEIEGHIERNKVPEHFIHPSVRGL